MSDSALLHRLSRTQSPKNREELRNRIMKRIAGSPLQNATKAQMVNSELMRIQILSRIAHPRLTSSFDRIREQFTPNIVHMALLRSEVLDRIRNWQPTPLPVWQRNWKPLAVTALFLITLRIAPSLFIASSIQASSESQLIPMTGIVSVTSGAAWHNVTEEKLSISTPLTIRTDADSSATIIIRDEAVLRLGENTEIVLRESAYNTDVDGPIARVSYGQIWIASTLPEALFAGTTVVLPQGLLALKNGSVSLLADPQQSTVQVFHGFARALPTEENPIQLTQGEQIVLLNHNEQHRHMITKSMREEEWVQENLSRDAAHRIAVSEQHLASAENAAGLLPDSSFYFLKLASEKIDIGLTLSKEVRQEKRLQNAQTRLNEAISLLNAGKTEEAERPLAAYSNAIRSLATISETDAHALLAKTLITSSSTVSDALPHTNLHRAKEVVLEAAVDASASEVLPEELDLFLLSDALLEIENRIVQGDISGASNAFLGIEGAVLSVLEYERLGENIVGKNSLKAIKTITRSIIASIEQAKENTSESVALNELQNQLSSLFPTPEESEEIDQQTDSVCMTVREVVRRTNQFLADVYTYQTPRAQRNEVLRQISLLPDCPQSGRILAKVMNKVPVFTRSFVWDALQDMSAL